MFISRLTKQPGRRYGQFAGLGVSGTGAEAFASGAGAGATILPTSAEILDDGCSLKISYSAPGGGWTGPYTVSTDPTKMPVLICGLGGNVDQLDMSEVSVSPAVVSGNLEITVKMPGYAFPLELCSLNVPAGFIVDGAANSSQAISNLLVTNGSDKTQGSAHSRFASSPVVVWCTRDKWPVSGNTARIAFRAVDHWAGVEYVEVTFNDAVTPVSDPNVINVSGNIYRIAAPQTVDLYGYGDVSCFYIDLDTTAVSDALTWRTVTITKVRGKDGLDHNPTTGINGTISAVPGRSIAVRKTKTIRYVDATASGANNGTTKADAYTSFSAANSGIGASVDEVRVAPGSYTVTGTFNFDQSRTDRFLTWKPDLTMTGDGSGIVTANCTGQINFRNYQSFETIKWSVASGGQIRSSVNHHISFENCDFNFATKTQLSNFPFNSSDISFIGNRQNNGFRGPSVGRVGTTEHQSIIVHRCEIDSSGTSISGQLFDCWIDGYKTTNAMMSGFSPSDHSDFCHPFDVIGVGDPSTPGSGAAWVASAKTLTKSGAYTNMPATDLELACVQVTSTSGGVDQYASYQIESKTNANEIVLSSDSVIDVADNADVCFSISLPSYRNLMISNCLDIGNGNGSPWVYNLALFEGGGRNACVENNQAFNTQITQTIFMMSGDFYNVQVCGNTMLATDNTDDTKGPVITGNKCAGPYKGIGVLIRNNICHAISASIGDHVSGQRPTDFMRKKVYGPNVVTTQAADGAVGNIFKDGTVRTTVAGTDALYLTDTTGPTWDLTPLSNSPAHRLNYVGAPDDRKIDYYGRVIGGDCGAVSTDLSGGGPSSDNATILNYIGSNILQMVE